MIWRNIYGDFERNELHCFSQPRADGAFCLHCGAACVLHVGFTSAASRRRRARRENLAQVIPVTAQVVSRSGARTVGFEIDENHFANLMKADIKDAVYTASACANFQEQYRAEDVQGADTSVTAVSGLSALVGVTEESIAFENGYDLSIFGKRRAAVRGEPKLRGAVRVEFGRHALDAGFT